MSRLEVSDDATWLDVFGVAPGAEAAARDDFVQLVEIAVADDEALLITWDETDNSVRVQLKHGDRTVLDLFRETSHRLLIDNRNGARTITLEYGTDELAGRTTLQISPELSWSDSLLRV